MYICCTHLDPLHPPEHNQHIMGEDLSQNSTIKHGKLISLHCISSEMVIRAGFMPESILCSDLYVTVRQAEVYSVKGLKARDVNRQAVKTKRQAGKKVQKCQKWVSQ